jgi:hypothetical protein
MPALNREIYFSAATSRSCEQGRELQKWLWHGGNLRGLFGLCLGTTDDSLRGR